MHTSLEPRFRKRVPCRLQVTGSAHSGMVLNVSRTGMFVQTTAGASPGDAVHLDLAVGDADPLPIDARVVWRRVVAPHLRTVSTGGMGVHIQHANDAYFGFVAGLVVGQPADDVAAAERAVLPSYRVRVRLRGSSRTRVLLIEGADEGEARQRALDLVGGEWRVLGLESGTRLSRRSRS